MKFTHVIIVACVLILIMGCTGKTDGRDDNIPDANLSNQSNTSEDEEPCLDNGTPVCGSDGVTYARACIADGLGIDYTRGACEVCEDSDESNIYTEGSVRDASATRTDVCADDSSVKELVCVGTNVEERIIDCPDNFICEGGACKALSLACADTDNNNPSVKGTVTYQGESYPDTCYGTKQVNENVCSNEKQAVTRVTCAVGMTCLDGACVIDPNICLETDDGEDPENAGNLTFIKNGFKFNYEDICQGSDFVKEYSCTAEATIRTALISCGSNSTCDAGACRYALELDDASIIDDSARACTETDDGIDPEKRGKNTKGLNDEYEDTCASSKYVSEYFCVDNVLARKLVECKPYQECSGARCVDFDCEDTDGGIDIYTKGTFTIENRNRPLDEYCMTSHSVFEMYCGADSDLFGEEIECPSGLCISGRCTQ